MGAQLTVYGILYVLTIAGALMVLFNRDTVKSAMALVLVMISIAAHYFFMGQEFVGAIQIIVYAGAIMVLFLFVIMILNVRDREVSPWYLKGVRAWGGAIALLFFFLIAYGIMSFEDKAKASAAAPPPSVIELSTLLTTKFALPFVLTSILLLVAVIGAVVMGRRFDPETGEEYHPSEGDLAEDSPA